MSDPSVEEQGLSPRSAWPVSLYVVTVVLTLSCGILIRTIGGSTTISDLRPDSDTVIFDRHGVELGRFHPESNMEPVPLENMAPILIDAVLIALDPDYLELDEIEIWPLVSPIFKGNSEDDSPSITQLYLRLEEGVPSSRTAALQEASRAIHLERTNPREALLEQYLSRVPLGRNVFGVEAASMSWYGLGAKNLGIGQAAHLASQMVRQAWPQSPDTSADVILTRLYEAGLITEREAINQRQALLEGVIVPERTDNLINPTVAGVGLMPTLEKIYGRFADQYGVDALIKGDVTIVSTLDLDLQRRIAGIADTAASTPEIQQLGIVVLDDRNQLRAIYGTGDLSPEEIGLGPLQRVAWSPEVMELEVSNVAGDISVLQLAELHSSIARNGLKYKTGVLLKIADRSDDQVARFSHRVLEKFDSETISKLAKELDDLVTIDENVGLSEGQVRVRGKQGGDIKQSVTWYGGASERFAVALWMRHLTGETMASEAIEVSQLRRERETLRVAGNIFSELHSDG
ncbi:MAG: transglycosylase domain-containing protein [Actinomycetota bacterium]|nr:transglycosylase domain-containing protein [Actinomycetota bacterium]